MRVPRLACCCLLLTVGSAAFGQAQAALHRADVRRDQARAVKTVRVLDDCDKVPTETLDVLRIGYVIVNHGELLEQKRQNQALFRILAGGLTNVAGSNGVNMPVPFRAFMGNQVPLPEPMSRHKYRSQLRQDFVAAFKLGTRRLCSEWAEDVAWSYAPSKGTECAGLPNELVDPLQDSAVYYGKERWHIRQQILRRYRYPLEPRAESCEDFARSMIAEARMLDP